MAYSWVQTHSQGSKPPSAILSPDRVHLSFAVVDKALDVYKAPDCTAPALLISTDSVQTADMSTHRLYFA